MSQGEEWRKKPSLPQSCSHLKVLSQLFEVRLQANNIESCPTHTGAARSPSSELRGQQTPPHQVGSWTLVNIHCGLYKCTTGEYTLLYTALSAHSIHFSAFNFQGIGLGEFGGKCCKNPGTGFSLQDDLGPRLHIVNVTLNFRQKFFHMIHRTLIKVSNVILSHMCTRISLIQSGQVNKPYSQLT